MNLSFYSAYAVDVNVQEVVDCCWPVSRLTFCGREIHGLYNFGSCSAKPQICKMEVHLEIFPFSWFCTFKFRLLYQLT